MCLNKSSLHNAHAFEVVFLSMLSYVWKKFASISTVVLTNMVTQIEMSLNEWPFSWFIDYEMDCSRFSTKPCEWWEMGMRLGYSIFMN